MDQQKIGKFISELRKEKNLTQAQLANKLGISDRAISNYENGRRMPELSLIKPLCDELGITVNDLLSGERIDKEIYQEKFEENVLNTIDYSNRKMKRNGFILKGIVGSILGILSIFAIIFCIDIDRMNHNQPVFFSTWGFKYQPPVLLNEGVVEINYVSNTQHIQIELDEKTKNRLINAFNNIPTKLEYNLEDVGQFGAMNHFEIEKSDEEIKLAYQPIEGAIEYNGQKYIIPMDSEFFELIFELEYLHSIRGYKIYTYSEWVDEKHLIKLPMENYAIVSTQMQIDDIFEKLEIETDKQYNMTVQDYIDTKFVDVLINSDVEEFTNTGRYVLNSVFELDDIEFKVIEIIDGELGAVLFKYNK